MGGPTTVSGLSNVWFSNGEEKVEEIGGSARLEIDETTDPVTGEVITETSSKELIQCEPGEKVLWGNFDEMGEKLDGEVYLVCREA